MDFQRVKNRFRPGARLGAVVALLSSLVTIGATWPAASASDGDLSVAVAIVGNPTNVGAGQNIVYRVTYSCLANSGAPPVTCDGATIKDVLPTYTDINGVTQRVSYVASSGSVHTSNNGVYDPASGAVTFTFGPSLTAGSAGTVDITVKSTDGITPDNTTITDQATMTLNAATATSAPVAVALRAKTVLFVDKFGPPTAALGAVQGYTITTCADATSDVNFGRLPAKNVVVTDTFPAGAVFVSTTMPGTQTISGNTVTWQVGDIAVGACVQGAVGFRYSAPAFADGDSVTNAADATGDQPGGGAAVPAHDQVVSAVAAGDGGTFVKFVDRSTAAPGDAVRWGLSFNNDGATTLNNPVFTDTVPAQINVGAIDTGVTLPATSVAVTYSVDGGLTYTALPGSPFNTQTTQSIPVGPLLAPGQFVTNVRWAYPSVAAGFKTYGTLVTFPGLETTAVDPDHNGVTYRALNVKNCATASFTTALSPGGITRSSCATVPVNQRPMPGITGQAQGLPSTGDISRGQTVAYLIDARNTTRNTNAALNDPVVTALLPAGLAFVPGSTVFTPASSGISVAPTVVTLADFAGPGTTLVRWTWPKGTNIARFTDFNLTYQVTVNSNAPLVVLTTDFSISNVNDPQFQDFTTCELGVGTITDDTDNRDGDANAFIDERCDNTVSNKVITGAGLDSSKTVQGELDPTFVTSGSTAPGGRANYRLTVADNGTTSFAPGAVFIDTLPFVGDTLVASTAPRNSQWAPYLVGQIQGLGATVEYSTSSNPCRGEVGGPTTGCDVPNWQMWNSTLAANPTVIKSLRFTFPTVLSPGDSFSFTWEMRTPLDLSLVGKVANNSFAYSVQPVGGGNALQSEPVATALTVTSAPLGNEIGDFVWNDLNANGVQDAGEPGVSGVSVDLDGPGLDGIAHTADDVAVLHTFTDPNGHYLFQNVPPGSYFVQFGQPANMAGTLAGQGADRAVDSDADPTTGSTAVFDFCTNGAPCTNTDVDAGFYSLTARVGIVKTTNGIDVAAAPGPLLPLGSPVTWTYTVTNLASVTLGSVQVSDNKIPSLPCTWPQLKAGESATCTVNGTASTRGQYSNVATVNAVSTAGAAVSATDTSYYYGVDARVSITKTTNGVHSASAPGPYVPVGAPVSWSYVVTNTGNVDLTNVKVTDTPQGAICTVASLAVNASTTCSASAAAQAGQYSNVGKVVATPPVGADVTASDSSFYFGARFGVSVVTSVNGSDANVAPGVLAPIGAAVHWTYVVTNGGNTTLRSVAVTDDSGLAVDCGGVTTLVPAAVLTCDRSGVATAGQHTNIGTVAATPTGGVQLSAADPANYFGVTQGLSIVKTVNGVHATSAPGLYVAVGARVTWSYVVTNSSNVDLSNVRVTDVPVGPVCTAPTLAAGASMTCSAMDFAAAGQYSNVGKVVATPPLGPDVTASDSSFYFGADDEVQIVTSVNGDDANTGPGPFVPVGDPTAWTYLVTNSGNTTVDITVTDDVQGAATCATSTLAPGDHVTCTIDSVSAAAQHTDVGTVHAVTPDGTLLTMSDPANYFGTQPGLAIVTSVNGDDANTAPGPSVLVGDPVTWDYHVTNTGTLPLIDVAVSDDVAGAITCPKASLDPNESMTCEQVGAAVAGQQHHVGSVIGVTASGVKIGATDGAFYFGASSSVSIVTLVDNNDANQAPGPNLFTDEAITLTYVIHNTGDTTLSNLMLIDTKEARVACPLETLAPGASMTCTTTDHPVDGQNVNVGTVTGTAPTLANSLNPFSIVAASSGATVSASDPAYYFGIRHPASSPDPAPPPPATGGWSLPITGTDVSGLTIWAAALLAIGAGCMTAVRRRRRLQPSARS